VTPAQAWRAKSNSTRSSAQSASWGGATTVFALFQALAAYGYSSLFAATGGEPRVLMLVGAAALGIALLSEVLLARAAWKPVRDEAAASRPAPDGKRCTIPS
jgi:hypothetical protein